MKQLIHQFDSVFVSLVSRIPRSFDPLFLTLTALGDPFVTITIGASVIIWGGYIHNLRLSLAGAMVPATLVVGSLIKMSVERARPVSEFSHTLRLDTFSFPSGHASGSMIAYGLCAYLALSLLPAPWGWIIAILLFLLPFAIGLSRVYLGVHYPSDVVAGWLLGIVFLTFIILVIHPFGSVS